MIQLHIRSRTKKSDSDSTQKPLTPYDQSRRILFPAKVIVSYRQVISSRLYGRLTKLVHSLVEHFKTPVIN